MLEEEDLLFGEVAISLNFITPEQLERAVDELKAYPELKIGELLLKKGLLNKANIMEILTKQFQLKEQHKEQRTAAILSDSDEQEKDIPPKETIKAIAAPALVKVKKDSTDIPVESEQSFAPVSIPERLKELLTLAKSMNASDLHLSVNSKPFIRKYKKIYFLDYPVFSSEDIETILFSSISQYQKRLLLQNKSLDFCLQGEIGRFRTCLYKQMNGWEAVFKIISDSIPSCDDLKLPAAIHRLTEHHQGLILITGPSGSGKSTTLAALIDLINRTRKDHIITIEDPIEYIQHPIQCQITQRGLEIHTKSFTNALKAALRQDPDIIMIGEMRDRETMALAISAAETGHLVLGTMPTSSAPRTVNAIVDFFPPNQQNQIRSMISESLRGIICQQLVPNVDNTGCELALEILVFDPGVAAIVRQNQLHQLVSLMQTGKSKGMMLMDDSLLDLVLNKKIDPQIAYNITDNKKLFEPYIEKA